MSFGGDDIRAVKFLSSGAVFSAFCGYCFLIVCRPILQAFRATQGAIPIKGKLFLIAVEFPFVWDAITCTFPYLIAGAGGLIGWYLYQMIFADLLRVEISYEIEESDVELPCFPWREDRLQLIIGLQHEAQSMKLLQKPKYLIIDEKAMFQNVLVTGTIGTGKTASVMYPLLKQALFYEAHDSQKKAGMLVLDVKGNFYEQVVAFAEQCGRGEDIVLIQLGGTYRYNPVHKPDMEAVDLAERCRIVLDLFNTSGNKKDAFWDVKAAQMMTECIRLLRNTVGYVTLERVHDLITNKTFLQMALQLLDTCMELTAGKQSVESGELTKMKEWLFHQKADEGDEGIVARVVDVMTEQALRAARLMETIGGAYPLSYHPERDKDIFWDGKEQGMISAEVRDELLFFIDELQVSEFDYQKCSTFFTGEFQSKAENTIETVKAVLTQITSFFASSEEIARSFCAPLEQLNFFGFGEAINEGKIVVLAMNIAEHPHVARTIAAYLKLDFQAEIQQRTSAHRGLNRTRPMFFFSDEYQEYVTQNDGNFYGISREARCCSIVATQSYSSLLKSLGGRPAFDTLIQNLVSKIALRSDDKLTIETMQMLTGKIERTKTSTNISESATDSQKSGLFGGLTARKASISESINTSIQKEALFEERDFTQRLKQFKAICFLADADGMQEPTMAHLLPYFSEPIRSLGGTQL